MCIYFGLSQAVYCADTVLSPQEKSAAEMILEIMLGQNKIFNSTKRFFLRQLKAKWWYCVVRRVLSFGLRI